LFAETLDQPAGDFNTDYRTVHFRLIQNLRPISSFGWIWSVVFKTRSIHPLLRILEENEFLSVGEMVEENVN